MSQIRIVIGESHSMRAAWNTFYDTWVMHHLYNPHFLLVAYRDTLSVKCRDISEKSLLDIVNIFIVQRSRPQLTSITFTETEVIFEVSESGSRRWWEYLVNALRCYTTTLENLSIVMS